MRITACLLAVLLGASTGFAEEAIVWSAERPLAKADFRGRVPAAAANASLSWINIETAWECADGALMATAHAAFARHARGGGARRAACGVVRANA